MTPRTVFLVRHAHRDTTDRLLDNGLSDKGRRQAERLTAFFLRKMGGSVRPKILSSPSRRCRETVAPLARVWKTRITSDIRLSEGGKRESPATFVKRVRRFIERGKMFAFPRWGPQGPEVVMICSHGDWIPAAVGVLTGEKIHLKKGGWAELRIGDTAIELVRVRQRP